MKLALNCQFLDLDRQLIILHIKISLPSVTSFAVTWIKSFKAMIVLA